MYYTFSLYLIEYDSDGIVTDKHKIYDWWSEENLIGPPSDEQVRKVAKDYPRRHFKKTYIFELISETNM